MDLGTIKHHVETGVITNTREFEHAVKLMLANAIIYNEEGHFVHVAAMEMRKDAMQAINVRVAATLRLLNGFPRSC